MIIDKLKQLTRGKFARGPIAVCAGDTLSLTYKDETGEETLISHQITEAGLYDEGVLFSGEFEGRRALGGIIVEKK